VLGIDHPYGDGPRSTPPVVPFGAWVMWPGRWGNSEYVMLGKLGNGPRSHAWQNPK
jgi:hypothetical protein